MDIEKIISLVFFRPPLWDQKDPCHHNRYVLDKMWDEVANEMNSTKEAVRSRWKTLRDGFRKEIKKVSKSRSGDTGLSPAAQNYYWPYFNSLIFLKDQFESREGSGNLPCSPSTSDSTKDTQYENFVCKEEEIEVEEEEQPQQQQQEADECETSKENSDKAGQCNSQQDASPKSNQRRKRKLDDVGTALVDIERKKIELIEEEQKNMADEDRSFFNSLIPHVKKVPPEKKLLLRMKIQELIQIYAYEQ